MINMVLCRLHLIPLYLLVGCQGQVFQPPVFTPSPSAYEVNENTPQGTELTRLTATSPGGLPLTFSINTVDYFAIGNVDPNTVRIYHTANLDFEKVKEVRIIVTASDRSGSKTDKDIVVTVHDLNDNPPQIVGNNLVMVPENAPVGYTVQNALMVYDLDTGVNAELNVGCFVDISKPEILIFTQRACDTFNVSSTRNANGNYSVHLTLKRPLDYETITSYIMALNATDIAPPYFSDTKNYVIKVQDVEDMPPVWVGAPYNTFPYEEQSLGAVITAIEAYDGDVAALPTRNLKFQLLNDTRNWLALTQPSNVSGHFKSNITVGSRMDREAYANSSIYTVGLKVTELFPNNGSEDLSAVTLTHVSINLLDINDNGPVFYSNYSQLSSPLTLRVDENLGVNTPLPNFLVSVADADSIVNTFNLSLEGPTSDTFQLSPMFGVGSAVLSLTVRKEANMDYEKPEYRRMELTIKAIERTDSPRFSSQVTVIVVLIDKNDNSPQWKQGRYNAVVTSSMFAGSRVALCEAVDADSGIFGQMTYSLGETSDMVQINPSTGEVTLKRNATGRDTVEVELVATDGGGLSSTAQLVVVIKSSVVGKPVFDSHIYSGSVIEKRAEFLQNVQVHATDVDSPQILYTIIAGNTADNAFVLAPYSGFLRLSRNLTKSDGLQFNLTVQASDQGETPNTDIAYVIINLLEANDYTPQFLQTSYAKAISEIAPVGTLVLNCSAVDGDGPQRKSGVVSYRIASGDNTQRFVIDAKSGAISVNSALDYDIQNIYIIQVEAVDGGTPSRSSVVMVNISITDANNKLPQFITALYMQYLSENARIGATVLTVNAFDADKTCNLVYSIVLDSFQAKDAFGREVISSSNFDFRNAFAINMHSGEITTLLSLNREAVSYVSFRVSATDLNGESPRLQQAFADVQINIRQDSLGVPEFLNEPWTPEKPQITVNITEGFIGHVFTLVACDSLSREPISVFRIRSANPGNLFTINAYGDVILNQALDYEQLSDRSKTLVVAAEAANGQESTTILMFNLVNRIDNAPSFQKTDYTFSAIDGNVGGLKLGTVSAIDIEENVNLIYSLRGEDADYFVINYKGDIYARQNLIVNAEVKSRYDLLVDVTDERREGPITTVPVTIQVQTSNKHTPLCGQYPYTFKVAVDAPSGFYVGAVHATDLDVGDSVRYSLMENGMFTVDQATGQLLVSGQLHQGETSFIIKLRDSTEPYREGECNVTIYITPPASWNLPIFIHPPVDNMTIVIPETSSIGYNITTIEINNPSQTITEYYLANLTNSNYFEIDRRGRIYIVNALPKEVGAYELIVVANSSTSEVSRKLNIQVDSGPSFSCHGAVTDPIPQFEVTLGNGSVQKSIGRVSACSTNGSVYYYLVDCLDGSTSASKALFTMNLTGELSVNPAMLSKDVASVYTLCVNASNSPSNAWLRAAQQKIIVRVTDKSVTNLSFTNTAVSSVMSASTSSGEKIAQITARASYAETANLGLSDITYSLTNIDFVRGATTIKGSQNAAILNAFYILRDGRVVTNLPNYSDFVGGHFIITITATSSTGEKASMDLNVYVSSEQLILVFDRSPEDVTRFLPDFYKKLQETYGYRFVTQKIGYHVDPDNQQTNLNMTDVEVQVFYPNGTLVPANELDAILQKMYAENQKLFSAYGVNSSGITAKYTQSRTGDTYGYLDWYGWEWILWLIIASAIVLVIEALILLCCHQYIWNKYVTGSRHSSPAYYGR